MDLVVPPGGEQHDRDQQQAEADVPVQRETGQHFLETEQHQRPDHSAVEIADATDDDHDQQCSRLRPLQQVGTGQPRQVGEQRAGEPGQGAAQRETDETVAEHRVAERFHARLVVTDGLDRATEPGAGQTSEKGHHQRETAERRVEESAVTGQAEAAQSHPAGQWQAVVAAENPCRNEQVVGHLRESEGDHDEIDASRAQADGADDKRQKAGDAHRQREGEQGIADSVVHAHGRDIGTSAEKGGVAERKHAAEPEHQIEAAGRQREDQDTGGEADVKRLAPGIKHWWQHGQSQQQRDDKRLLVVGRPIESHQARAGNRPCGRKNRIAAISR